MAAAGKGRLEDVAALLTAGADPLARSRDGSSARDWAAKFGHSDVADFLGSHMQVLSRHHLQIHQQVLLPIFCELHRCNAMQRHQ